MLTNDNYNNTASTISHNLNQLSISTKHKNWSALVAYEYLIRTKEALKGHKEFQNITTEELKLFPQIRQFVL